MTINLKTLRKNLANKIHSMNLILFFMSSCRNFSLWSLQKKLFAIYLLIFTYLHYHHNNFFSIFVRCWISHSYMRKLFPITLQTTHDDEIEKNVMKNSFFASIAFVEFNYYSNFSCTMLNIVWVMKEFLLLKSDVLLGDLQF